MRVRIILFLLLPLLWRCTQPKTDLGNIEGYAPIYQPVASAHTISGGAPQATVHAGKIYAYRNYFFQVEQGKGIHVMARSGARQANKIAFINIPGCTEIAIQSDHLYTNNVNDLVVINIADVANPSVSSRQANAFPQIDQNFPSFTNVYFECPDPSKGFVVGWEKKVLNNPNCRR